MAMLVVRETIEANQDIVDTLPAFEPQWEIVTRKIELIETLAEEQERDNKGLAADKTRIREMLIDTMEIVGTQTKSWAAVNREEAIWSRIETSRAKLRRTGSKLAEMANGLHVLVGERLEDLANYGVTQDWLTS